MSKAKRAKRASRPNPRIDRNQKNVIDLQNYNQSSRKQVMLIPRNVTQEDYIESLTNDQKAIVVATGPAGTGKTYLAALAAIQALHSGQCKKIVITRPNRAVDDRDIGFLPGNITEKMAPWWRPIRDIFLKYYTPQNLENMLETEIIEISPMAYMRGRTFDDSWIIADEMQNSSPEQMKMVATRIGENSKLIITGDPKQTDQKEKVNGLDDFIERQDKNLNFISFHIFSKKDIERNPIIEIILSNY